MLNGARLHLYPTLFHYTTRESQQCVCVELTLDQHVFISLDCGRVCLIAPTHRQYLTGTATILSAIGLGSTAFAQEGPPPIAFVEINAENEYIVIKNVSGEQVSLSGYNVNLEVGQKVNQIPDEPFPQGTTLDANETLTIATGTASTVEGDVTLGYEKAMINNTNPDTLAIINPSGEIVIRSDTQSHFVSDTTTTTTPKPTEEPTPTSTDEPTAEPTDTATESPTEEPTQTSTETPTETTTSEPTQQPTDTPTEEPTTTQDPMQTPDEQEATDLDCDGRTTTEEQRLGTDPNNADSDGDGWSDLSELNRDHDPLDSSDHPQ